MSAALFSRSARGLANVQIFLNVDRVAYCEGSSIFDPASVDDPSYMGLDHAFWSMIVARLYPGERIRFRPVGSKTQALQQARVAWVGEESQAGRRHSLACVDRDYDEWPHAVEIYSPPENYLLTEGYSVENDLYVMCGPARLAAMVAPRASRAERTRLTDALRCASTALSRPVRMDIFFRRAGKKIFDTDGVPAFISKLGSINELLNRQINTRIIDATNDVVSADGCRSYGEFRAKYGLQSCAVSRCDTRGDLDVPGKTWLKIVCEVANRFGKKIPNWSGINKDRLADLLLAEFEANFFQRAGEVSASPRTLSWTRYMAQISAERERRNGGMSRAVNISQDATHQPPE